MICLPDWKLFTQGIAAEARSKMSQSIVFPPRVFSPAILSPLVLCYLWRMLFPRVSEKHLWKEIISKTVCEDNVVGYISTMEHCAPRILKMQNNNYRSIWEYIMARPPPHNIASALVSLFPVSEKYIRFSEQTKHFMYVYSFMFNSSLCNNLFGILLIL